MTNNPFFKPTPLYKEFMILDMIEKDPHITQRQMSQELGVAVSMVNSYLDTYEQAGYLKREYKSSKSVEYLITKSGIERKEVLNIGFLKSAQLLYNTAKENIVSYLNRIADQGFTNILLYGAGEVAEIMLNAIVFDNSSRVKILGVIDDNEEKYGTQIVGSNILPPSELANINHDGVLVSSYTNQTMIIARLKNLNEPDSKVLSFFN